MLQPRPLSVLVALAYAGAVYGVSSPTPPNTGPSAAPREDVAPAVVEVADPRHRGIYVEAAADAATPDADSLYRGLFRTSKRSANSVVVENGRVFFVRAGTSTLARAEEPAPESPATQPVLLAPAEALPAPTPDPAPQRRQRAKAVAPAPAVAAPDPQPHEEVVPVPVAMPAAQAHEPVSFSLESEDAPLALPETPAPAEEAETATLDLADRLAALPPQRRALPKAVIAFALPGIVELASMREAGEWLILREPLRPGSR